LTLGRRRKKKINEKKCLMYLLDFLPAKGGKCILSFKFLAFPLVIAMLRTGFGSRQFRRIHKYTGGVLFFLYFACGVILFGSLYFFLVDVNDFSTQRNPV